MNGVTGRMGTNQHLVRSILAIREQGGLLLPDGTRLWPDPILVGRNETKLRELAAEHWDLAIQHRSRGLSGGSRELHLFRRANDDASRDGAARGDPGG